MTLCELCGYSAGENCLQSPWRKPGNPCPPWRGAREESNDSLAYATGSVNIGLLFVLCKNFSAKNVPAKNARDAKKFCLIRDSHRTLLPDKVPAAVLWGLPIYGYMIR